MAELRPYRPGDRDAVYDICARTAEEIGAGVGNVAVTAGRAVKNEVGDIDVDVDVTRNRSGDSAANASTER